ncbi:MAG: VOC family protein [Pseudobacteriovorax sp.]|nr:VOC family protein [Pseudobacteriovorax sp.]
MKYLHAMVRVKNVEESLDFYCKQLGLIETRRYDSEKGRFTLIYLATEEGAPEVELTYNWDVPETYGNARNFGHLAFAVDNIYDACQRLQDHGTTILRPPRDGKMAFVTSPDDISIELLQKGEALAPKEPWASMESQGSW